MTPFDSAEEFWHFCAVMGCNHGPSVRLGKVWAATELQAKARVEKFFFGGYFHPNQIYVWRERSIKPHIIDPLVWI